MVMRYFTRLKNRLFPYLYSAAHDASEHGWPVMRAMVLEFLDDPGCRNVDRQYMLGSALLVAPVFRQDHVVEYFVPDGKWTNLLNGKQITGGQWRRETVDFMHLPLLVRQNTILPMSANEEQPQWRLADELTLNLFEIADGADLSTRVASSDGAAATFRCRRDGANLRLESDGHARSVKVSLRSIRAARALSNGRLLRETSEGLSVEWIDTNKPLSMSVVE